MLLVRRLQPLHADAADHLAVDMGMLPKHQPKTLVAVGAEPPLPVLHRVLLGKDPWMKKMRRTSMRRLRWKPHLSLG
jgi:hypothetical protein